MATEPLRVQSSTKREVEGLSRVLGVTPADLLTRAWGHYKETPEFRESFTMAQKAFQTGDLERVVEMLDDSRAAWAERAAERAGESGADYEVLAAAEVSGEYH